MKPLSRSVRQFPEDKPDQAIMPSSNDWNQTGPGRRYRPKPFDFSYILSPYPPVDSHLANSLDNLSLADDMITETTSQDAGLADEPVICSRRSCRNPARTNHKQCGNCIDKHAAQKRARVQQRRNQGIKDPITGEITKRCADCGVPAVKYRCGRCGKKKNASNQAVYSKRRGKGVCTRCGRERDREGSCCKRCLNGEKSRYNQNRKSTG
jgi:predicted amidophosphoribosyltransferase